MKLNAMKDLKIALQQLEDELQDKTDAIDWDKSDGESWQDKCQQREEYYSYGFDKVFEIKEIIEEMKNTTIDEF